MKERGILLPIFSLSSKYGIGDFGNEAYEFIDILSENGMSYWEILPINKREIKDRTVYDDFKEKYYNEKILNY